MSLHVYNTIQYYNLLKIAAVTTTDYSIIYVRFVYGDTCANSREMANTTVKMYVTLTLIIAFGDYKQQCKLAYRTTF